MGKRCRDISVNRIADVDAVLAGTPVARAATLVAGLGESDERCLAALGVADRLLVGGAVSRSRPRRARSARCGPSAPPAGLRVASAV